MADTTGIGAKLFSDLKRDYGLTNEQAAGVVGNFMHESAGFSTLQEISPTSGRGGYGFAQWTGDRRRSFESYVKSNDLDPESYAANYGFLRHELATDRYERQQFNKVKKATTAAEAARIISTEYLRPGTPRLGERTRLAKEALAFADTPVPPGDLNYDVATLTDTAPAAAPTPATLSNRGALVRGVTSPTGGNTELQAYIDAEAAKQAAARTGAGPVRLPDLPATTLGRRPVPQSIIERDPTKPAVSQGLLQALGSGSASARLNGTIATPAPARETNLAFDPGAVKARVISIPQDAALAAMLARRVAPTNASDRVRGNEAQTRNNVTTIASIPTGPALASFAPPPARLPDIAPPRRSVPQSTIERAPPRAPAPAPRVDYSQGPSGVGIMPSMQGMERLVAGNSGNAFRNDLGFAPKTAPAVAIPQSAIERSPPRQAPAPPATRVVPSVAVTIPKAAADSVGSGASWGALQNTMQTPIPMGNVMASAAPRVNDTGAGVSWDQFTGAMGPKMQVAQPAAAPKAQDRLGTPQLSAMTFNPQVQAQAQLPGKQQLEQATGFRTVTQEKRVTNPAWTAYRAANPAQATAIGSPIPLGDIVHTGSRDQVANRAKAVAELAAAPPFAPEQFITVKKQVRVPVAAPAPAFAPAPFAAPRLGAAVAPRIGVAPVPVMPFAPAATNPNPIMSLIGAIVGQRQPGDLLSSIMGARSPRPPVGAVLGTAGNGGQMVQGHNGVKNSITQNSDAWKRATGQSSYGSGQSNDTSYGGYQF